MKLDYEEKKAELEAPFQPIKFGINIDNFLSDILSIKNTFYVCFFCLVLFGPGQEGGASKGDGQWRGSLSCLFGLACICPQGEFYNIFDIVRLMCVHCIL